MNPFKPRKTTIASTLLIGKGFKGTVVNLELTFLQRGSLEYTYSPFNKKKTHSTAAGVSTGSSKRWTYCAIPEQILLIFSLINWKCFFLGGKFLIFFPLSQKPALELKNIWMRKRRNVFYCSLQITGFVCATKLRKFCNSSFSPLIRTIY